MLGTVVVTLEHAPLRLVSKESVTLTACYSVLYKALAADLATCDNFTRSALEIITVW